MVAFAALDGRLVAERVVAAEDQMVKLTLRLALKSGVRKAQF